MAIARDLFYGISGLSLAILVAGTVASPLAGCDRSFCLTPVIALGGQILGITPPSMPQNSTPSPANSPPSPDATPPLPLPDFRLTECPDGSIEPSVSEIPSTLARSLQKEVREGLKFSQLIELQGKLGNPKCNYRSGEVIIWRYLIRGGGGLVARESKDGVKIEFFGF